jgi:hypothetical protein
MRGQGDYPIGAANDPNAPWNQVDEYETYVKCDQCDGTGEIYYAYNFVTDTDWEVSREEWENLPADEDMALLRHQHVCRGEIEMCDICLGEGRIVETW